MSASWITDTVGSVAGFCTTLSMVPQLYSIWRRKSGSGVSAAMMLVFGLGVLLWLTFGIRTSSVPVIAANAATLALVIAILTFKARYDRRDRDQGSEIRDRGTVVSGQ
jgi:MtN3 and saliva related transmembrane protein